MGPVPPQVENALLATRQSQSHATVTLKLILHLSMLKMKLDSTTKLEPDY